METEKINLALIKKLDSIGISLGALRTYIKLRAYINDCAQTNCVELPLPQDIAQRLGIPPVDFQDYLLEQTKLVHDALTGDDYSMLSTDDNYWELAFGAT